MQLVITFVILGAMAFVFAFDGDLSKIGIGNKGKAQGEGKGKKKGATSPSGKKMNSSQENLPFKMIKSAGGGDAPALIVKNGDSYVGAIEVYGVNYNLLSIDEKHVLEEVFQKTLNGLDYPIQIFVQSRKINLDSYNTLYKKRIEELSEMLKHEQTKFRRLTERHADLSELEVARNDVQRVADQIKYGENVIDFINRFAASDDILDKKYFMITPYYYDASAFNQKQTEDEKYETALNTVMNRLESILMSLKGANIDGKVLSGAELAELLYTSYNKPDADKYKLNNAIKSGFSNYIVTSRPVEFKQLDRDKEKIEEEYRKKLEDLNNGIIEDHIEEVEEEEKVV